jgi:hypothetical protein
LRNVLWVNLVFVAERNWLERENRFARSPFFNLRTAHLRVTTNRARLIR